MDEGGRGGGGGASDTGADNLLSGPDEVTGRGGADGTCWLLVLATPDTDGNMDGGGADGGGSRVGGSGGIGPLLEGI